MPPPAPRTVTLEACERVSKVYQSSVEGNGGRTWLAEAEKARFWKRLMERRAANILISGMDGEEKKGETEGEKGKRLGLGEGFSTTASDLPMLGPALLLIGLKPESFSCFVAVDPNAGVTSYLTRAMMLELDARTPSLMKTQKATTAGHSTTLYRLIAGSAIQPNKRGRK